jgi:hypothetical protein
MSVLNKQVFVYKDVKFKGNAAFRRQKIFIFAAETKLSRRNKNLKS